jgi:hypothetical protein
MNNKDYQNNLLEIISMIKDKATYLKNIDPNSGSFDKKYFDGMAMAYYQVLDGIQSYIKSYDDLSLSEFGLDGYDPREILDYQPR